MAQSPQQKDQKSNKYMFTADYVKTEDIDEILLIDKESFLDNWSKSELEDIASNINKSDIALVCKKQDDPASAQIKIIGFGIVRILSKNGNKKISDNEKDESAEAEILRICIKKDERSLGAGSFLFEKMMKEIYDRYVEKVFLEVRPSNTPAITIYKKHGFSETSIRKNYYQNPNESALIMTNITKR